MSWCSHCLWSIQLILNIYVKTSKSGNTNLAMSEKLAVSPLSVGPIKSNIYWRLSYKHLKIKQCQKLWHEIDNSILNIPPLTPPLLKTSYYVLSPNLSSFLQITVNTVAHSLDFLWFFHPVYLKTKSETIIPTDNIPWIDKLQINIRKQL